MNLSTMGHKLRRSVLLQIGLTWFVLLLVPAAMQLIEGREVTTIDIFARALEGGS